MDREWLDVLKAYDIALNPEFHPVIIVHYPLNAKHTEQDHDRGGRDRKR